MTFYGKALEICHQSLPPNHPQTWKVLTNIGGLYYEKSNWLEALKYFERGLEIDKLLLSKNHPDLIASYNNLASIYHHMRNDNLAIEMFENVLNCSIALPPSFEIAHTNNNCGVLYFKLGNYTMALEKFRVAYEMGSKLHVMDASQLLM
ncbi:unnamed protein product [Didymodactylos carnosus]|uniref:Uncharacterized protein n=1 Tax=Didymodactylos carnosus TaxID=1234261 RepID=A0A815X472_9BILA|nr:unnamed protein product [Didymodactylos carnosus]CAF1553151.1 unnamed protein product [Didymodactylos carnosus]CAF4025879.1 unnamed protein product [Didymodactylos carnosus]CAF4414298.1 unnamed protein product [Didymodactylos carnosus]